MLNEQLEDSYISHCPLPPVAEIEELGAPPNEGAKWYLGDDPILREAAVGKARDISQIRKVFFAGVISSLLLLVALAMRDFIAGTVEDLFPSGGFENRLAVFLLVAGVAFFLVLVIYEAELDL